MSPWTGTRRLTRLALRRDRVTLPAWIVSLGAFTGLTTAMFDASFKTQADLALDTQMVAINTGMRMIGLVSGPTVGGYSMHRSYTTLAVLAALMSALAVARHTRQNEELGRAELVGAAVVGRYAGLAAAVTVALAANAVLAVVLGLALVASGQPVTGSFLAGASIAMVGSVFTGVAAVACQLSSSSRGALGITGLVLALSFLLSGVGNMLADVDDRTFRISATWPVWLSPIGWGQQARPFAEDQWWPLAVGLPVLALLLGLSSTLVSRRDVGRGMWAERRGPAHARHALLSPVGLTFRLQRGALLGWGIALGGFGLILGSMSEQISDATGATAQFYSRMGGTDRIVDAYQASMVQFAGMFVAMYVVQVLLRMRTDEAGGTLEPVLAAGVTRSRWVLGHVVTAATGATALVLAFGLTMGLGAGLVLGDTARLVGELALAALVQLPGVAVLGAVVLVVVALVPRWAVPICWAVLIAALVLGPMFGPVLQAPAWLQDLSPFTHAPTFPAADVSVLPLVLLVALGVAVSAAAMAGVRRRDLLLPA